MAFSSLKLMADARLPSVTGERELPISKKPVTLQVMSLKEHKLQASATFNASRRDTLLYLTAETLGGSIIFSAEPAEARVGRLEGKKKIFEKFEEIRKKFEMSKPKNENTKQTHPAESQPKGEKLPPLAPPIPFPNPEGPIEPLVEAIVP